MKMTKRLISMAMCGIMATTSMVGVVASASDVTANDNYIVSEVERNDNGTMPYAATEVTEKKLSVSHVGSCEQEKDNWCWAACTQYVLKYFRISKTQTEIYKEAKGTDTVKDEMGKLSEIKTVLKNFGSKGFNSSNTGSPSYNLIKGKIDNGNIVILSGFFGSSTKGHDVVCYGYSSDAANNTYTLYIYDPSNITGECGNRTLTCSKTSDTTYTWSNGSKTKTYTVDNYLYGK